MIPLPKGVTVHVGALAFTGEIPEELCPARYRTPPVPTPAPRAPRVKSTPAQDPAAEEEPAGV